MSETSTEYVIGKEMGENYGNAFKNLENLISYEQLSAIVYCDPLRLSDACPYLNMTLHRFEIFEPLEIAHFIGQTAQESDGYVTLEEYADGSDYEGRADLGNFQKGDGKKFKGRSPIQLTGRDNYKKCGTFFGWDLISNPEMIADWYHGFLVAGWYWRYERPYIKKLALNDDLIGVTKAINGGTNGLENRAEYLRKAKIAFGI
jgi:putative chitinase